MAKETSVTISFRLSAASHERLQQLADAAGITPHQLARSLVVLQLEERLESKAEETRPMLEACEQLRFAFGKGIEAILLNVTELPPEEVRRWVFEKVLSREEKD